MPPTYWQFHQHVKRAHLQSLIFNQGNKAVIEMKNLEHWKFDETYYKAIVIDNPIAPDTASCNCKCYIFYLILFLGYLITWVIIYFVKLLLRA